MTPVDDNKKKQRPTVIKSKFDKMKNRLSTSEGIKTVSFAFFPIHCWMLSTLSPVTILLIKNDSSKFVVRLHNGSCSDFS